MRIQENSEKIIEKEVFDETFWSEQKSSEKEDFVPFSSWHDKIAERSENNEVAVQQKENQRQDVDNKFSSKSDNEFEVLYDETRENLDQYIALSPEDISQEFEEKIIGDTQNNSQDRKRNYQRIEPVSKKILSEQKDLISNLKSEVENLKKTLEEKEIIHKKNIEDLHIQFKIETAKNIEKQIDQGLIEIKKIIGDEIGKIFKQLFYQKIEDKVLRDFLQKVTNIALDEMQPLKLEANRELLNVIKSLNLVDEKKIKFVESENQEVRLYCENYLLSTQLQPILQKLNEFIK